MSGTMDPLRERGLDGSGLLTEVVHAIRGEKLYR